MEEEINLSPKESLDEPVAELATNFARLSFVSTDYSCSGHLYKNGVFSGPAPEGFYWATSGGFWPFNVDHDDVRSEDFLSQLEKLVDQFKSASMKFHEEEGKKYSVFLSFEKCEGLEVSNLGKITVPEESGKTFYEEQFIKFWEAFNELVIGFLSEKEINIKVTQVLEDTKKGIYEVKDGQFMEP